MKIGIPREIKNNENRVGMTPTGVSELSKHGHEVYVQHNAGENSGFSDADYEAVGAKILPDIAAVYAEADMILKVKEPIPSEYSLVRENQVVFTYFHFACDRALTEAMMKSKAVCIAYETVQLSDGSLPLLVEKPLYFDPFGQIEFAPVGHNIIAPCKVLVQGSILFYPFRDSGFS